MRKLLPVAVTGGDAGAAPMDVCLCSKYVEKGAPRGRTFGHGTRAHRKRERKRRDLEIALYFPHFYLHTKARTGHGVQSLEVLTECQERSRYLLLSRSLSSFLS